LYTHKDSTLFRNVRSPQPTALAKLRDDFDLFIRAVMLGVFSRVVEGETNEEGSYYLQISPGNFDSIGNERAIRKSGFTDEHRPLVAEKVDEKLGRCTDAVQLSALYSLGIYYEQKIFKPIKQLDKNLQSKTIETFPSVVMKGIKEEFKRMALDAGLDGNALEALRSKLALNETGFSDTKALDRWSKEIKGSESDGYHTDVGGNPAPKRVVRSEFFDADWLAGLVGTGATKAAGAVVAAEQSSAASISPTSQSSVMDEIRKLGELKKEGLLDEQEFAEAKKALLAKLKG